MLSKSEMPEQLRQIPDPPEKLYVRGNLTNCLTAPLLAVVGSRKVSTYGRQVTSKLVRGVAGQGVGIVSGLALGVDGLAHSAALEMSAPTIAVMPCGLDAIYPQSHFHMAKQILESGGALISEYPDGTPPLRHHFIARNRLVSGLADAVLITEAAAKSGTLHTANFALDQGKTVLAVPGNITSELSQGTNNLLKAGALIVTEPADILLAMGVDDSVSQRELFGDTPAESAVLQHLQAGITDSATLQKITKLSASEFSQALTMLEIRGIIKNHGSGQWSTR